ncbi:bifunctional DNA primase/polymerase [Tessaracoccus sp. MC1865]|uniref:phage/plasmid primase, P4 family n=1 Tax=Tessaracoccus sp. MC1865 TaxID=2760310 RepID=UPI001603D8E0|nr:phage/plasmid primase, P4 family [Tessaracoccus sp. MC1865]MBB1482352.1 bifunctional DNA primase/polymerase [Tessaracoccus sp. MC1865]QTO38180.1 bifunctional DNA primase/polymerase [Tessaracoccus sp. MC1865]
MGVAEAAALAVALDLVAAGVPVFAAPPNTHGPGGAPDWGRMEGYALPHGWQNTEPDPAHVAAWRPGWALCAVMGRTVDGLDVDTHKGGAASLAALAEAGALPTAYGVACTPSGGRHLLIAPTGCNSRDGFAHGLDLKAGAPDGNGRGFLFIAPTVKPSKVSGELVPYSWEQRPALASIAPDAATAALAATVAAARATRPADGPAPVGGTNDPQRAQAYALATLEGLRRELDAAAEWPEGETDDHGRGWEKLVADAAHTVGRLARTDGTGITPETGLAVLLDLVPDGMAVDVDPATKWASQWRRGEPFTLPPSGPDLFGLTGPAPVQTATTGTVVDPRRVMGAMHAQAQFADGLATSSSGRHCFVPGIGWHYFDGKRWREDTDNARALRALRDLLERTAAANIDNGDVLKHVRATSSATQMEGVLRIARASSELVRDVDQLDADPYALNVANGTLDLRTLELRPHDAGDGITKVCRAAWTPGTDWQASRWGTFLAEVLPDAEVRAYLQRYVGLALLGEVIEHKLVVLTGTGRNGKGVFYGAVSWALGDYAVSAEPDLFMHREGAHPTGQMDLRGARWVIVSETESGRRLADATVKRLTGGDAIRARRMGKDFVQFEPSHTAAMVTNHLPRVSAEDAAIWARLRVVPFNVVVPDGDQDATLPSKLKGEANAVLAWAVEGLRDYYTRGMAEPEAVTLATGAYRDDNDDLAEFLEERTEATTGAGVLVSELHDAYTSWCQSRRLDPEGRKRFAELLRGRGFNTVKTNKGMTFRGVKLLGFQMQHPLSEPESAVSAVCPVPPTIPSYAEGTSESAQTALHPTFAPLATPTPPGLTTAQADILNRLSAAAREDN